MRERIQPVEVSAIQETVARARQVSGLRGADPWWLTFAITGSEPALRQVAAALAQEGARNLDRAETGFLNAKMLSPADAALIAQRITHVQQLAHRAGAELFAVDADSDLDVAASSFSEIWKGYSSGTI